MPGLPDQPGEMPRERLITSGAAALKTEELLAILFRTGTQGCDVLEMSHELLAAYGGLKNLARATAAELTGANSPVKGLGTAKAVTLLAALELGRRAAQEDSTSATLGERLVYWGRQLAGEEREYIVAIYLDRRERPIADERLSYGGLDGAVIDVPYLLRRAVRLDSAALVLLHNHPDETAEPSDDDLRLTCQIHKMLRVLGIGFKGHYIIAGRKIIKIDETNTPEEHKKPLAAAQRGK